jgi:hypothetical protein
MISIPNKMGDQILGALMSNWSEDHYAAGWLSGLEEFLPNRLNKKPIALLTHEEQMMLYLAEKLGHWVVWQPDGELEYQPYRPLGGTDASKTDGSQG